MEPTNLPPDHDPFAWIRAEAVARGGAVWDTEHHLVVHVPGKDRLIVGFDNLSSIDEPVKREPWAYGLARARGWGSLGVMIKRKDWFRCPQLWAVLEHLRDEGLFASYPDVSMYGSSMGGFGAALFAELSPGCTVLAMAPQSTLAQDIAPFENRYRHARTFADWTTGPWRDASIGIRAAGKAYLLFDPEVPQDRLHVQRLAGDNTILLPCPHMTHKLPPMFKRMNILKDLAIHGLTGELTEPQFYQLIRARRDAIPYVMSLATTAAKRGHARLAIRAVDSVRARTDNWKLRKLRRELRDTLTGSQ